MHAHTDTRTKQQQRAQVCMQEHAREHGFKQQRNSENKRGQQMTANIKRADQPIFFDYQPSRHNSDADRAGYETGATANADIASAACFAAGVLTGATLRGATRLRGGARLTAELLPRVVVCLAPAWRTDHSWHDSDSAAKYLFLKALKCRTTPTRSRRGI